MPARASHHRRTPPSSAAADPFAAPGSPTVSQDGTIAYGTVSWSVVPASLDPGYKDQLDDAVAPARDAGLTVEYGGGAGKIGETTSDRTSEAVGIGAALILLLIMVASVVAAVLPLLSATISVLVGLSVVGLLAALTTFPVTAPTVATLLGLGVAIDYGLFLVARHRDQLDHGASSVDAAGRGHGHLRLGHRGRRWHRRRRDPRALRGRGALRRRDGTGSRRRRRRRGARRAHPGARAARPHR